MSKSTASAFIGKWGPTILTAICLPILASWAKYTIAQEQVGLVTQRELTDYKAGHEKWGNAVLGDIHDRLSENSVRLADVAKQVNMIAETVARLDERSRRQAALSEFRMEPSTLPMSKEIIIR